MFLWSKGHRSESQGLLITDGHGLQWVCTLVVYILGLYYNSLTIRRGLITLSVHHIQIQAEPL